jgi:hypothetical protein
MLSASVKVTLGSTIALIILELGRNYSSFPQNAIIEQLLKNVSNGSIESYDGILVTLLTSIGIFIPLYLTNLTSVIEEKYTELPEKIRLLIFRERIENTAIQFLFLLTAFILVSLIYSAVFEVRPVIVILIAAILGGLAIPMLFVYFTRQHSIFLDPTSFSDRLLQELIDWSRRATIKGYSWDDASFQIHYHNQATSIIESLQSLAELALREQQRREALIYFVVKTISGFLPLYLLATKSQIPEKSKWFDQVIKFKDWYLLDGSEFPSLSIAISTNTSLAPKSELNSEWMEQQLLNILERTVNLLCKNYDFNSAFRLLALADKAFESLGRAWQINTARSSFQKIEISIYMTNLTQEQGVVNENHNSLAQIQSVSNLNTLGIHVLLGFFASFRILNVNNLSESIMRIDWRSKTSIYEMTMPPSLFKGLEYLLPRIQFELAVQGYVVTAKWYIIQIALQTVAKELHEQISQLLLLGKEIYLTPAKNALGRGQNVISTVTLISGLEYFNKFRNQLQLIDKFTAEIEKRRILKRMPWAEWNQSQILEEIAKIEENLVINMAHNIPKLTQDEIVLTTETPDFLGQAVTIVGESCFEALSENRQRLFDTLFPNYFIGIFKKNTTSIREVSRWQNSTAAVLFGSDSFLDLLDLSGYSFLFKEFHQSEEIWLTVKNTWDSYLQTEDNLINVQFLVAYASISRKQIGITSRQMLRNQWKQDFEQCLSTIAIKQCTYADQPIWDYEIIRDHPSLLIRTFAGSHLAGTFSATSLDAASVFVDLYLRSTINVEEIIDYRFEDVQNQLDWQSRREKSCGFTPTIGNDHITKD